MFSYSFFWENKTTILPYVLLALAIISLWVKRHPGIWGTLLAFSTISGLITGKLLPEALITIILLGLGYYLYFQSPSIQTRFLAGSLAFCISLLILFFHKMPGFQNFLVVDRLKLTEDALPYSAYLNFDKPLIALYTLAFGFTFINQSLSKQSLRALPMLFLTIIIMPILGVLSHYVAFEPKWNTLFYLWALNNLLFVCTTEEVFFRGLVQQTLTQKLKNYPGGYLIALITASVLFGLLHYRGGASYIVLSTIAGLFYGSVYLISRRIEFSIITHFLLNTVHFLLFTYPALQPL